MKFSETYLGQEILVNGFPGIVAYYYGYKDKTMGGVVLSKKRNKVFISTFAHYRDEAVKFGTTLTEEETNGTYYVCVYDNSPYSLVPVDLDDDRLLALHSLAKEQGLL